MNGSVKGLLIKDVRLMRSQMMFFVVVMVGWGAFMATSIAPAFMVGYIAMLFSFLTLSTLNYDEFENGAAYLFTLPISRRDYIKEKYVFGFGIITLPTILLAILSYMVAMVKGMELDPLDYLLTIAGSLVIAYLFLAIEIPIQVRCGSERGRVVSILVIGMMSCAPGMLKYLCNLAEIDSVWVIGIVSGLGKEGTVLLSVLAVAVLLCISYKVSCGIMDKKEF